MRLHGQKGEGVAVVISCADDKQSIRGVCQKKVGDDSALLAQKRSNLVKAFPEVARESQRPHAGKQEMRSGKPVNSPYSWPSLTMKYRIVIILSSLAFVVGAAVTTAAPVAENWENHCAKCHGADGKGQTKAGKKLQVKDYTDAKVQAEMKDAEMIKATSDGIFDKAGKEKMKAYKDELSVDEIKDFVAYIRKFKT